MAPDIQATLVCKALQLAIVQRQSPVGLIVHSDRGSRYASAAHQALLSKHGLVGSMSRKGISSIADHSIGIYNNLQMHPSKPPPIHNTS